MPHSAAGRKAFSLKTAHAAPLDEDRPVDPQQRSGVIRSKAPRGQRLAKLTNSTRTLQLFLPSWLCSCEPEGVTNPYAYENLAHRMTFAEQFGLLSSVFLFAHVEGNLSLRQITSNFKNLKFHRDDDFVQFHSPMKYLSTRGGDERLSFEEVNLLPVTLKSLFTGRTDSLDWPRSQRWIVHP